MPAPGAPTLDARIVVSGRVDLALHAAAGETVALIGPNGSGKSTVVDALAGLVRLSAGHIRLGERVLNDVDGRVEVPPHRRQVTRLGQRALLFPHLSLRGNVEFGLRSRGVRRRAATTEATAWLERTGLAHLAQRRPHAVSGGQAQRAAVARALATRPALSLWDEPMSAVDADAAPLLRDLLARELTGRTALVVTHDLADVIALADRVVVLERGRVVQDAPVSEFLADPAAGFAARLVARSA